VAGLPAGRFRTKAATPEAIPSKGVIPGNPYIHTKGKI
jgi:hypothetical protein